MAKRSKYAMLSMFNYLIPHSRLLQNNKRKEPTSSTLKVSLSSHKTEIRLQLCSQRMNEWT